MPTQDCQPVIVVSGLPRSGTSLMMQMLRAGGVPVLSDEQRAADEDNPRGYLELERVKNLRTDKSWLGEAHGKAVKVIHLLLPELPDDREYRVIFMHRALEEVVQSQAKMLERSGKQGAALGADRLVAVFKNQLAQVSAGLHKRCNMRVLSVEHARLLASPREEAQRVAEFVDRQLDVDAMAGAVDQNLYRNRADHQAGGRR